MRRRQLRSQPDETPADNLAGKPIDSSPDLRKTRYMRQLCRQPTASGMVKIRASRIIADCIYCGSDAFIVSKQAVRAMWAGDSRRRDEAAP